MRKPLLISLPLIIATVTVIGYHAIFSLPERAQVSAISADKTELALQCYKSKDAASIDNNGELNILVWNIYKQNRDNWKQSLNQLIQGKQLALFQEASMSEELKVWIGEQGWFGSQVDAFKAFQTTAGVLNLSYSSPLKACAYTELEPWLRLPKSALYALYPLSNGQQLAVVNIHAVNFTYGTVEYQRQLGVLVDELEQHSGPIIVAGDFNSWSEERLGVMQSALKRIGVAEVAFNPDYRTEFVTGLALDHVFYRGLVLETAEAPQSDASDHNPLLVQFRLENQNVQSPN
ncbi:endonuclease/exonuclease/phosphatase family protein [Vibrio sp. RE86]|uniref:endonuclease/exonuclease/phosphatase family protein n=1 Tax=Vibrio sp. RE86 TaxID=2607605 RepID=UPI001493813E|nr:endonuclease/exonuclease/phosphatase family protein [Vibrio sp. RE86]NOH81202.1 endonuclease/exonuclease/phosphatase family protein [Vibrio sp. RE86]